MKTLITGIRHTVLCALLLALAACTTMERNHGYVPREEDLAQVVVGTSTRDTVAVDVGRPSSVGVLTGSAWYYVGSRFNHYAWREPQEVARQVVAISFDEAGVVTNVERFGLENGQVVTISRRVTDSNVAGLTFLQQLLGSIGSVGVGQLDKL